MFALKDKILGLLGFAETDSTAQLIDNTLWIFLGVILIISVGFLAWTFISTKVESRKLQK